MKYADLDHLKPLGTSNVTYPSGTAYLRETVEIFDLIRKGTALAAVLYLCSDRIILRKTFSDCRCSVYLGHEQIQQ